RESAAADKQDIGRVDLQEFLLRMLAAALRRHGRNCAFHNLEKRLLDAFARDIAGDGRIVGLSRDLIDLVDVDDAALRPLDIVDGDREHPLRLPLTDDVIIENFADFLRGRYTVARLDQRGLVLLADDVHAELDAFIADENRRAGNQLADLVLTLAAE